MKRFKHSSTFYRHKKIMLQKIRSERPLPYQESGPRTQLPTEFPETDISPNRSPEINISKDCTQPPTEFPETDISQNRSPEMNIYKDLEKTSASESEYEYPQLPLAENNISTNLQKFLPNWAITINIAHSAITSLLKGLAKSGLSGLPKDSRSLMETPKSVKLDKMGNGEFWYHGIQNCLLGIESFITETSGEENCLKLNFHIDGLPIANSSKNQFWPILVHVANFSNFPPQVVAIYSGDSKPRSVQEYLQQFVTELLQLLESGLKLADVEFLVKINAFICDTPARSFIKCVVSFNGYYSCLKCTVAGEYYHRQKRISFPQTDCELRLDEQFRAKTYTRHHQKNQDGDFIVSPLEELPIDIIQDIIIADSLHLIDLGVTKKCINIWVHGSKDLQIKFFNHQTTEISPWLVESNKRLPTELHRSARPLSCLSFWKAVEYRSFLFYLGPVILKDNLPSELYKHFLLLVCAVIICSSSYFSSKLHIAEEMFIDYIEGFISNYGIHAISSNIHNLCHIVNDIRRFGPLKNISSYPFENKLGVVKNLLRSGNKPLSQVAKRLLEFNKQNGFRTVNLKNNFILKYEVLDPSQKPPGVKTAFKKLILKDVCFAANVKDQWLVTKNNVIVKVCSIYQTENNKYVIYGLKLQKAVDFFKYPFPSYNIYISQEVFGEQINVKEQDIKCKLVSLNYNNKIVFLPLIHTFDMFNKDVLN